MPGRGPESWMSRSHCWSLSVAPSPVPHLHVLLTCLCLSFPPVKWAVVALVLSDCCRDCDGNAGQRAKRGDSGYTWEVGGSFCKGDTLHDLGTV